MIDLTLDYDARRYWPKVRIGAMDECWPWLGAKKSAGHGYFRRYRPKIKDYQAHRISYTFWVGPISPDLELHHSCENPECVNPTHLVPLTKSEHSKIGNSIQAKNARKTHCKHGHEFTEENIYRNSLGHRVCRECRRRFSRERKARDRAARLVL